MKTLCYLLFFFFCISLTSYGQFTPVVKCSKWFTHYYFVFKAKYQISSESLVIKANQTLRDTTDNKINGYVMIRFTVNCKGERGNYLIFQSDTNYQETKFNKAITDKLLAFTKEINLWPKGELKGQYYDYHAFMSYKFTDGKITEIIP